MAPMKAKVNLKTIVSELDFFSEKEVFYRDLAKGIRDLLGGERDSWPTPRTWPHCSTRSCRT